MSPCKSLTFIEATAAKWIGHVPEMKRMLMILVESGSAAGNELL